MRAMVAIGGHDFDREAFTAMLAALSGIDCEIVRQPEAARRMNPRDLQAFDALLLYDLPGLDFRAAADAPRLLPAPEAFRIGFEALLLDGVGIVALHHAIAGWPAWPVYGDILGARFRYRPALADGRVLADSGYAPDVEFGVEVADAAHPVTAGLPAQFTLRDEPYCCEVDAAVQPLLRADARYTGAAFRSAAQAVRAPDAAAPGQWRHAPASSLIAWSRTLYASRIVGIQPGDTASTFANPHWRRLLANALHWVARSADGVLEQGGIGVLL